MKIEFKHVTPDPLKDIKHNEKSIWGNTFALKHSEKVLLNAASGKGKTTFTHLIAGIRKDFSGDIYFDGNDIVNFTPEEWAKIRKQEISFIFQDLQLFYHLSVMDNLKVKNQLSNTFTEDELKTMLDKLEILDKAETECNLLSMGQQQRVAIIRSLCQPFQWLIMDEPFSHLDELNTEKSLQLINKRCNTINAGFVLTSLGSYHKADYNKELYL